jgi:hypothetical protein
MFNKVSKDTKSLFSYDEEDIYKLRRKMQVFFTPVMRNSCILIFIFIFTFLIGYYNRYDVVRFVPQMKYFYDKMDLESLYKGKDLILKRINIKHLDKKGEHFVEVSGMLINSGKYKVELPPIKVSLINQDGSIEDSTVKKLTMPILASEFSSLFRILLRNTTIDAKTVKINFCTDIQSCEDTQTVADKKAAEKAQQKQIEEIIKQKRKMQNSKKR